MKVYLVYISMYGELISETGDSTEIVGIFKDKEKAKEKADFLANEDIRCNNYVLDNERNGEETYYRLFWNNQENWDCYYEIFVEEREVE